MSDNGFWGKINPDKYVMPDYQKAEDVADIPMWLTEYEINDVNGQNGSKFKSVLLTCQDESGNEVLVRTACQPIVELIMDVDRMSKAEKKQALPCGIMIIREGKSWKIVPHK